MESKIQYAGNGNNGTFVSSIKTWRDSSNNIGMPFLSADAAGSGAEDCDTCNCERVGISCLSGKKPQEQLNRWTR